MGTPASRAKRGSTLSAAERRMRASIAADTRWAFEPDRVAATAPARNAAWERILDEVDPKKELPVDERHRRATSLRRARMRELAFKSAAARRARPVKATKVSTP